MRSDVDGGAVVRRVEGPGVEATLEHAAVLLDHPVSSSSAAVQRHWAPKSLGDGLGTRPDHLLDVVVVNVLSPHGDFATQDQRRLGCVETSRRLVQVHHVPGVLCVIEVPVVLGSRYNLVASSSNLAHHVSGDPDLDDAGVLVNLAVADENLLPENGAGLRGVDSVCQLFGNTLCLRDEVVVEQIVISPALLRHPTYDVRVLPPAAIDDFVATQVQRTGTRSFNDIP